MFPEVPGEILVRLDGERGSLSKVGESEQQQSQRLDSIGRLAALFPGAGSKRRLPWNRSVIQRMGIGSINCRLVRFESAELDNAAGNKTAEPGLEIHSLGGVLSPGGPGKASASKQHVVKPHFDEDTAS